MKRILIILLTLISLSIQAQERPRVAIVLSGGGAKGLAHIGALKVIEEAGLPVDIITGTSMGSLIGALYSIGYSTDELDSLVRAQDWIDLFTDRTDPNTLTLRQREEQNTYALIRGISSDRPERGGLIRGRNLEHLFRQLCTYYLDSMSFDSLPIPFACIATDIVTNTEVDLHSGSLIKAMRASMAIPGVFTPVRWGDSVLIDGGLQNNYPADIAQQMGADIIIGISVQSPLASAEELIDAGSVMNQIININCKKKYEENIAISDVFIQVDVSGYGAASFTSSAIDSLIRRGAEAARKHWDELINIRQSNHIDSTVHKSSIPKTHAPFNANQSTRIPTRIPVASVGFRFDTEEMGAVQLNLKLPLPTRLPMGVQGTLRLGRRLLARAEGTLLTNIAGFNPTLSYTYRNNDLDIYDAGTRTYNVRYRQHTINLTPFDMRLRKYDLQLGIRWDRFNYYGQLLTAEGNIPPLDNDHYFSYFANVDLNTENEWYYPTNGNRLHISYTYHTTNLIGFGNKAGLSDIRFHWRGSIPISEHLTFQPLFSVRLLPGSDIPLAFINAIGGDSFGQYVEQQYPFTGIGHIEIAERYLSSIQFQFQYHLLSNHYILAKLGAGYHTDIFNTFYSDQMLYGIQLGYSYRSFIGPLSANIGYSNRTHGPYLYINIGHIF